MSEQLGTCKSHPWLHVERNKFCVDWKPATLTATNAPPRVAAPITAEQVEKAVKDSAEESDSTGAVFYHWQEAADALNKGRAAESPAGEQLEKLRDEQLMFHWVSEVRCDHKNKLDKVFCACGWEGTWEFSVGMAVMTWWKHVDALLASSPEAKEPSR